MLLTSSMASHEEAEAAAGMHHQHPATAINPQSDQTHQNHHQEARQDAAAGAQQTRSTLYQLRDASRIDSVLEQMTRLDQWLDMNVEDETRKKTALRIVNYHGTTIILMALQRWKKQSKAFSGVAMRCLVNLSFLAPSTTPLIANAGLHLILSATQDYADNYAVTSNAIGLLHNCAEYQMKSRNDHDSATSEQVSSEDCLDLVIRTMKKWPTSSYHQERGCLYFYEMSKMPETRQLLLHDKGICSLLVQTLEAHRTSSNGENQRVYQAAQLALFVYVSSPPSV